MVIKKQIKYGLNVSDAEFVLIDSNGEIECSELKINGKNQDKKTTENYFRTNKKELIDIYSASLIN